MMMSKMMSKMMRVALIEKIPSLGWMEVVMIVVRIDGMRHSTVRRTGRDAQRLRGTGAAGKLGMQLLLGGTGATLAGIIRTALIDILGKPGNRNVSKQAVGRKQRMKKELCTSLTHRE